MKKLLIFFVFVSIIIIFVGCTNNSSASKNKAAAKVLSPGEDVYVRYCKLCHGSTGDLGLSGAANLKISVLNTAEIATVVAEGRKSMPGWKNQLTPQQITDVSVYVQTLRK